jgi:hypothetical protein
MVEKHAQTCVNLFKFIVYDFSPSIIMFFSLVLVSFLFELYPCKLKNC